MTTYYKELELERIADEIAENTDRNYHTENAVYIAEIFGDEHDKVIAQYIKNQHNKKGHMQPAEIIIRNRLIDGILKRLDKTTRALIEQGL